jgi:CheY-like chemotaxis protein
VRGQILVIDDKKTLLQIMRRTLHKHQHDVLCMERAREALALIDRGRVFDIIFCDLMMPDMTGIEFHEMLLKSNNELAKRIVFMTGGATTVKADAFLRTLPNRIVEKPFEPIALLELVQGLVAEARRSQP